MNSLIQNFIKACPNTICDIISDIINNDILYMSGAKCCINDKGNTIRIVTKAGDDVKIKNIDIDQYNNFDCDFPKEVIPIAILKIMRDIIVQYFENDDSYDGRAGCGLFYDYIQKYCKKLCVDDLVALCKIDKRYDNRHPHDDHHVSHDDDLFTMITCGSCTFTLQEHISKKKYNEFLTKMKEPKDENTIVGL